MERGTKTIINSMIGVGFLTLIIGTPHLLNSLASPEPIREPGFVTRIIDGDTFELSTGEKVRLICVNTPEQDEDGYQEAKDFLRTRIANKTVLIEKDVSEHDKFRRLLRYVYLNESGEIHFINRELVQRGFAEVKRYKPNTRRCDEIALS